MPEKKVTHTKPAELRCRAEEQLRVHRETVRPPETTAELLMLLHELQVSRIELEMQNAILQAERDENLALGTYTELYDFAPVGYLSLDKNRTIRSINFSGAELLGAERSLVTGRSFPCFLAENERPVFLDFLDTVVTSGGKEVCEVTLLNHAGTQHFIRIEATVSPSGEECHVVLIDITERKLLESEQQRQLREISDLKLQIEAENVYLRAEIRDRLDPGKLIGASAALRQVLTQAELAAPTDTTVLIQGETGTGKELIARYLHQRSNRSRRNLCILSCAAIPANLLESELFGHEKGSFTGALDRRLGHFEVADQSTLFLDEIGELPLEAQAKLLRVLQEGEFCRVGSTRTIKTDVRIIAATNRDLADEVHEGRFREDLYYRLSVFPLTVPPLRERSEDIPSLVWAFVCELGAKMGKSITRINAREMTALQQYVWPGNIRELRNVIEHALIFSRGDTLQITLPATLHPSRRQSLLLHDVEYQHITEVLRSTNWRVDGPKGAARLLGLHPNTLHSRIKKLGISSQSATHDIS